MTKTWLKELNKMLALFRPFSFTILAALEVILELPDVVFTKTPKFDFFNLILALLSNLGSKLDLVTHQ